MTAPRLTICDDQDTLAAQAADFVIDRAREAVKQRGQFTWVLTGGQTPEGMYQLLAESSRRDAMPWSRTYVFMSDERFVPYSDPRSNFGMARRALLAKVPILAAHLFPMPTDGPTPAAAARYADRLADFFSEDTARRRPPCFDLILLGLGEDGHTASLFPGAAALRVEDAWATWSPSGTLPPSVDRITLTFPVLNAARQVAFLVAGEKKAAAVRDVLEGRTDVADRPAAGVRPHDGVLTWFLDEDAARLLSRQFSP
ncbi:MAG: 6-phosphogluconolactonase [Thermoguttaceae bacterium]